MFSTQDASSGFCQIKINDQDKGKTTFTSLHALYRSTAFTNATWREDRAEEFERAMNTIFWAAKWQITLVDLNDIIIFFRSTKEHVDHIQTVLGPLSRANGPLKLDNRFFDNCIEYLVHVIQLGRLAILMKVTDSKRRLQLPKNMIELKSFPVFALYSNGLYRDSHI